ncbi:hypothetical protein QZH47_22260 [Pseudomonas corrugata]
MMQSRFDPRVHIDWKTPGGELLGLLQHYYPDIDVFVGQPFEALLDELSNEMPEICFQALANALAERGYDLWNLDAGGDDYRPVVVPTEQREAFARHWQGQEDFTASLIEPEKASVAERKTARKPARRSKVNWLQEVHDYPGPTYVHDGNYHNGWAAITEQDDEQWLCFLIDYNPWPPAEQDMLEHRTDGLDGADLQLIDANAQRSLWRRRVKRGDYSSDDRYKYEVRQGDDIQAFGPAEVEWPGFEQPSVVVDAEVFERQRLYEPVPMTRIWRITAQASEVIFEHPDDLTILPFGHRRLLFMQHNGPQCWIWNQDPPHQAIAAKPMPAVDGYHLRASTAYLGVMRSCCSAKTSARTSKTRATTRPCCWRGASTWSRAPQRRRCWMALAVRCARTPACSSQSQRIITLRTFHGHVHVSRGHGDWWVWNYATHTFGSYTLAWFWNQLDNQVLKLSSQDIRRIKPQVRYLPAQDRYLAFEADFVARLPVFSEMLEAKGGEVLSFD